MKLIAAIFAFIASLFSPVQAQPFTARVTYVYDGDTIQVIAQGKKLRIRIAAIDAPESGQNYGEASRALADRLVAHKVVRIEPRAVDKYGRLVAKVTVGDRDMGLAMIQSGLAWHYTHFTDSQSKVDWVAYKQAEKAARTARTGLWRENKPMEPWTYREEQR